MAWISFQKFRAPAILVLAVVICSFLSAVLNGQVLAASAESEGVGSQSFQTPEQQEKKIDPWKEFTISSIEPDIKDQSVRLVFTEICDYTRIRDSLKIFPPVRLQWHRSYMKENSIQIRGKFKAGQKYAVVLPEDLYCRGRKYVATLNTFAMPDHKPVLDFSEKGAIIERDSRQMIHADVRNVDEVTFEGLRIPAILLPYAMDAVARKCSFKECTEELMQKNQPISGLLEKAPDLEAFFGKCIIDRQMFFPVKERNKTHTFSMPLTFRQDREKGAIELIGLQGSAQGRKVEGPLKLFRITDLSLTYKKSAASVLIWVTSLRTGEPVKGVRLIAFAHDRAAALLGSTDKDGLLTVRNGEGRTHLYLDNSRPAAINPLLLDKLRFLVAATDSDVSFIEVTHDGNVKPDWVNQVPAGQGEPQVLKGHVFTERGIYRPGETVHFKGTIREYRVQGIAPPREMTAGFVILNAKNEKIYDKDMALSSFGTAGDSLEIQSFFPLGTYTIQMKFGKDKKTEVSRTFEVQEFRPPRHFAEVYTKHEKRKTRDYVNRDMELDILACEILGRYYAGGPVKHGKVRWKVYYTGTHFDDKAYPGFSFGNFMEKRTTLLESGESILDEAGSLAVTLPMSDEVVSGVYGMEVMATVVDFDGRASTQSAVYQKKPNFLVGISAHPESIEAGESQILKLVVIDKNGTPVTRGTIDVEIMQKGWTYVRKRNEQGDEFWDWHQIWRKEISSTLPISREETLFDFDFVYGGEYLLKFSYKGKDGRVYGSSTWYNVQGAFYGYEYANRERNFEKLSILSDKTLYRPGETVRLYLNPHRPLSKVLMTIEQNDIVSHRVMDLPRDRKYVDIPLTAQFMPNVYISFLGTVARDQFPVFTGEIDDTAPAFLFGVQNIEVRQDMTQMKVSIHESGDDFKARPGEEVTLNLQVTDSRGTGVKSELAIGVVNENVLALTGYETPSLETLTRFLSPLAVFTGELRAELLRQTPYGFVENKPVTGGGGLAKRPEAVTSRIRKDFSPVAYFNPAVLTDENGAATVRFTLPDTMTTYRVYAVACDEGSKFASGQEALLAVKEFYLEPGIPRFFTKGDDFRFAISAFNKTDTAGSVQLTVDGGPGLDLTPSEGPHPLQAFDRTIIPVLGRAVKPGISKLAVTGGFDTRQDAMEIKIPVNSGLLSTSDIVFGTVKQSTDIAYQFPKGTDQIPWDELGADDVKVLLTLSGSPFLRMAKGFEYLLRYPYGCIEQTSSGVLPLAALRGLVQQGLIPNITKEQTDKFLEAGVARILSMQTSSGGFGYWPGNLRPNRWGTIYAAIALTHAKEAGFEVPDTPMNNALKYLEKAFRRADDDEERTFNAFAAYILAKNRRLEKKRFDGLYEGIEDLSREGALVLVLAAHESGFVPEKKLTKLTKSLLKKTREKDRSDVFYARYREPALALLAGARVIPDHSLTGKQAARLLGGINPQGIWTSTSDTGWALVALGTYFEGASFSEAPVTLSVTQPGSEPLSLQLDAKGHETLALDPKRFLKDPRLMVTHDGDQEIIYMLSLTFPRADYADKGYSNGFEIHKAIENTDGTKTIRVGDVVKVNVVVHVEDTGTYLVLEDPLPAGLVAVNTALKSEEQVGEQSREDSWCYWDSETGAYRFVPNYFEIRDDRVLVFKDRAWQGTYRYAYYARAVISGEFVLPSTKIQLMYAPDVVGYTPVGRISISERGEAE